MVEEDDISQENQIKMARIEIARLEAQKLEIVAQANAQKSNLAKVVAQLDFLEISACFLTLSAIIFRKPALCGLNSKGLDALRIVLVISQATPLGVRFMLHFVQRGMLFSCGTYISFSL